MTSTEEPRVTIVVLNWNGREDTLICLNSLTKVRFPRRKVIVVDNGSTDGSVAAFRAAQPTVEIIETGRNLGYAGGNNIGIEHAIRQGADYVLVLNNDTKLDAEAVNCAVAVAQAVGDRAGVVGFATYRYEQPEVLDNLGLRWTNGPPYLPTAAELAGKDFLPVESAHGCAMLLTRQLLESIGGFEEDFFLMCEEEDLCARARCAGFAVVAAIGARVWHKGSVSFGGEESPLRLFYSYRNTPLYEKRRFVETNKLHLFHAYMKQYRDSVRYKADVYLWKHRPALAFAVLAGLRCAEAEKWGKKQIPLGLRLRVWMDMINIIARGKTRAVWQRIKYVERWANQFYR